MLSRPLRFVVPLCHKLKWICAACTVTLLMACTGITGGAPLMAVLFDIPAPGKEPSSVPTPKAPRRELPKPDTGLEISKEYIAMKEATFKAGPPPDWPKVLETLPKDDDGNIVWADALEQKLITPAADIEGKAPQPKVMDEDIELSTSGKPNRMVVFSHAVHTTWLRCTNCHTAIFEKEAGSAKITMEAIDEGKYCGVCHDKVALAPDGCKGCHKPIKKS